MAAAVCTAVACTVEAEAATAAATEATTAVACMVEAEEAMAEGAATTAAATVSRSVCFGRRARWTSEQARLTGAYLTRFQNRRRSRRLQR